MKLKQGQRTATMPEAVSAPGRAVAARSLTRMGADLSYGREAFQNRSVGTRSRHEPGRPIDPIRRFGKPKQHQIFEDCQEAHCNEHATIGKSCLTPGLSKPRRGCVDERKRYPSSPERQKHTSERPSRRGRPY